MRSPRSILLPWLVLLISACGVPEEDHRAALARIDSLEAVIDDLEHGAERLLATAAQAYDAGDDEAAIQASEELLNRHPQAPEAQEAEAILARSEERKAAAAEVARRAAEAEAARAQREREAAERERQQRLARAVSGLWRRRDDVEGITWYWDRQSSYYVNSSSRVALYIGQRDGGSPFLRFTVRYKADDWLFIESYVFNVDGINYRLNPGYSEVERDNGSSGIWEWIDMPAAGPALRIAQAIADSRKTVIRYRGQQYYRDRTVTQTEKVGLRKVLDAYEALGGP